MKPILLSILILFLLTGCASGLLSVNEGVAKFSIPFDFPKTQEQELREKKILEEIERAEEEMERAEEATK